MAELKSIRVDLTMQGSSFKDGHFVAKELLKFNNVINTSLIRLNIILHYSLPLNACAYLICQIY